MFGERLEGPIEPNLKGEIVRKSLADKIENKAGNLNLLLGQLAMMQLAYEEGRDIQPYLDELHSLSCACGVSWLDDAANLFKQIYNAKLGA